jgi:outer membrane receptor for ferrienterochelin and colicins
MSRYKNIISGILLLVAITGAKGQGSGESETLSIWVDGVCGMCETRIETSALKVRGVSTANWNVDSKKLILEVNDKFKEERLHYKLANVGHDTKKLRAPDAVYNALHACCHYRVGDMPSDVHHEQGLYSRKVTGKVIERGADSTFALQGANIYWEGTSHGTITDISGIFEIDLSLLSNQLNVSYVGYGEVSIAVDEAMAFEVEFNTSVALGEVQITYRTSSSSINMKNPFNVQEMHEKELLKAACCNLSESFETNPAVEVSFTDAVTGTRQIEMLGLAGPYVQITQENMPSVRGLAALYGLTFTPGPWISGIQVNTGTGSVVNGFESIAGQINVELRKPEDSDSFYLNLYGNGGGRMEANINAAHSINEKWHTALLLHGKYNPIKMDRNNDGFIDQPVGTNAIFLNRWKYQGEDGLESQIGIKGTFIQNKSGQLDFDHDRSFTDQSPWGSYTNINRIEGWLKIGKVFPSKPFSSLGFQLSGSAHVQDALFGQRVYDAEQQSLYSNLIYQGIIGNTDHQFRTGASFQADNYNELLDTLTFMRNEIVPGIFYEYSYNYMDKFIIVSGLRGDYHNNYGLFITPRVNIRYSPAEKTAIKAMVGRGQKTASIISENIGMLASSRDIIIEGSNADLHYGLDPEIAWNTGASFGQEFVLGMQDGLFRVDYYYTWFTNQIIANYDRNPGVVYLSNLDGESYSHSMQAQVDYELFTRFDIRLAYRFNDVRSTIDGELLNEALTPRHRAFTNLAYETMNKWMFDLTINWQGAKRIPDTSPNPVDFQLDSYSPDFFLVNGQISKKIGERLEIYVGVENLLNYKQVNPILDSENPFGDYFDASLIWGPVFGRKTYGGLRFRIK